MGGGQSQEDNKQTNIAIAQVQTMSGQMETKLNYLGITLIVIGAILIIWFCYAVRTKCRRTAKRWLSKAVADLPPTAIKVQTTAQPTQSVY